MHQTNRRDFLKIAASLSAGVVAGTPGPLYADPQGPPGAVRAWRTSSREKFQPIEAPPQWEGAKDLSPVAIVLEPRTVYQEILGFGLSNGS